VIGGGDERRAEVEDEEPDRGNRRPWVPCERPCVSPATTTALALT
jgi:hypothetical protein